MRFLFFAAACLVAKALSQGGKSLQEVSKNHGGEKRVVCYYTNWSVYRKGLAKYQPQNINPYLCTHLVYAFGGLTDEFEVTAFDSYQDIEQGGYAKFNGMKQYNKGLKTLLAIGGWNEGSGRFSELVSLPEYRKNFTISVIRHLRRYQFDGLDLDWEYPASREGSVPEDKENYATLVKELREAFEDEGTKTTKSRLLLAMAVPAGQSYIDKGYDIPTLNQYLDFFSMLSYDYHSVYEPTVNHHSPLLPPPGISEYEWNAQLNVEWTVNYYLKKGASKNKLVIGIPTYGRSYTLLDGAFHAFGSSADGPGVKGKYTNEKGFLAFYEICESIASDGWEVRKPYPKRIGPFAFQGNQWVGYDDEKIVAIKAEYVRDNELGGIMFWTLDSDDFRGLCNGQKYPLIEAAKAALFAPPQDAAANEARALSDGASDSRNRNQISLPDRRKLKSTTAVPTTTTTTITTISSSRRRPGGQRRRGPQSRTTTTIDPLNTPEPPTTPSTVKGFSCRREGFYPNPDNCRQYYWCLNSGTAGLGIVAHTFTCPADLIFNKKIDGCDHPDRAKCNTNQNRGGAKATPPTTTPIPRTTEFDETLLEDYYYYYDDIFDEAANAGKENAVEGNISNSGGNQFQGPEVPEAADEKVTTAGKQQSGRNRPQYTPIQRDRTTAVAEEVAVAPVEETPSSRPSRPEYITLNRPRPSPVLSSEGREETDIFHAEPERDFLHEDPETVTERGGLNYVTLQRRRRPSTEAPAEETSQATDTGLEYVTLRRPRPVTTTELTQSFPIPSDFADDEQLTPIQNSEKNIVTELPTEKPKIRIPPSRRPRPQPSPEFRRRLTGRVRGNQDDQKQEKIEVKQEPIPPSDSSIRVISQKLTETEETTQAVTKPRSRPGVADVISASRRRNQGRFRPTRLPATVTDLPEVQPIETVDQQGIKQELEPTSVVQGREKIDPERGHQTEEITAKEIPSDIVTVGNNAAEETLDIFTQEDAKESGSGSPVEETLLLFSQDPAISGREELDVTIKDDSPVTETGSIIEEGILTKETQQLEPREEVATPVSPADKFFASLGQRNVELGTQTESPSRPDADVGGTSPSESEDSAVAKEADVVSSTIPKQEPTPELQNQPLEEGDSLYDEVYSYYDGDDVLLHDYSDFYSTQEQQHNSTLTALTDDTTASALVLSKHLSSPSDTLLSNLLEYSTNGSSLGQENNSSLDSDTSENQDSRTKVTTKSSLNPDSSQTSLEKFQTIFSTENPSVSSDFSSILGTSLSEDADDSFVEDPQAPAIKPPRTRQPPSLQLRPALRPRPVSGQDTKPSTEEATEKNVSQRPSFTDILSDTRFTPAPPRSQRPTARSRPRLQPRPVATTTAEPEEVSVITKSPFTETSTVTSTTKDPEVVLTTSDPTTAKSITSRPVTVESSARSVRPRISTASTTTTFPVADIEYVYDYYDDKGALGGSLGQLASLTEKAVLLPDGTIECYDTGYFPHPESCKKFISCSKTVRGKLRGWTYTCPQELVFDPVGGMCNWAEGVDCLSQKK